MMSLRKRLSLKLARQGRVGRTHRRSVSLRKNTATSGRSPSAAAVSSGVPGGSTNPTSPKTYRNLSFGMQRNGSHFHLFDLSDPLHDQAAPSIIWDLHPFDSLSEFYRYRDTARSQNPQCIIGAYWRSCLYRSGVTIPNCELETKDVDAAWKLSPEVKIYSNSDPAYEQYCLDMTVSAARTATIEAGVANAVALDLDAVSWDAAYYGVTPLTTFPVTAEDWTTAYLAFFEEAYAACHAEGLLSIVNVACNADAIPDYLAAVSPFADGLMTEAPFYNSAYMRALAATELAAYVTTLQQNKWVLLGPTLANEEWCLDYILETAQTYPKLLCTSTGEVHANPKYTIEVS